jgi:hypothetical protein
MRRHKDTKDTVRKWSRRIDESQGSHEKTDEPVRETEMLRGEDEVSGEEMVGLSFGRDVWVSAAARC